tara:strand:+ start:497 stop:1078 length:582 start_codon:yes stop_codon:yes gene_type:complete
MTDIYVEISKLTDKFRTMAYGITNDENKVNEAVQELMLYFLQANPEVIKKIYINDGIKGIIRYGAVALRRSLTSKRSNFYYKFDKYYTHIDEFTSTITYDVIETGEVIPNKHLYNLPNKDEDIMHNKKLYELELIDIQLDKLNWYDSEIFKLYYYEGNTLDSLAAKTKISRNSLFTTIDKVRTILKKELNEDV